MNLIVTRSSWRRRCLESLTKTFIGIWFGISQTTTSRMTSWCRTRTRTSSGNNSYTPMITWLSAIKHVWIRCYSRMADTDGSLHTSTRNSRSPRRRRPLNSRRRGRSHIAWVINSLGQPWKMSVKVLLAVRKGKWRRSKRWRSQRAVSIQAQWLQARIYSINDYNL
jgi:hypothetical protein